MPAAEIKLDHRITAGEPFILKESLFETLLLWQPRGGEAYTVKDSTNTLYRARVLELFKDAARMLAFEEIGASPDTLEILLLQALPEKERMELIIQKATELGVTRIVPFRSGRSTTLELRETKQKKSHKWQEIALKAAKQSRRATIPEILPYCGFAEALDIAKPFDLKLALREKPGIALLKDVLGKARREGIKKAAVIAGPEGGLTDEEVEVSQKAGFASASLGPRILRTETASILAVGLIQYELGG